MNFVNQHWTRWTTHTKSWMRGPISTCVTKAVLENCVCTVSALRGCSNCRTNPQSDGDDPVSPFHDHNLFAMEYIKIAHGTRSATPEDNDTLGNHLRFPDDQGFESFWRPVAWFKKTLGCDAPLQESDCVSLQTLQQQIELLVEQPPL